MSNTYPVEKIKIRKVNPVENKRLPTISTFTPYSPEPTTVNSLLHILPKLLVGKNM
jgi:hypothetical protein